MHSTYSKNTYENQADAQKLLSTKISKSEESGVNISVISKRQAIGGVLVITAAQQKETWCESI